MAIYSRLRSLAARQSGYIKHPTPFIYNIYRYIPSALACCDRPLFHRAVKRTCVYHLTYLSGRVGSRQAQTTELLLILHIAPILLLLIFE